MDASNLVDDIAQEIAALDPVVYALEHGGNHIAPVVAIGTGDRAQVPKQTRALLTSRPRRRFVVDEPQQFIAGNAVGLGGPIAPAVGRLDSGLELLSCKLRLLLPLDLQIVEELQEHNPGEKWQTIEVPI